MIRSNLITGDPILYAPERASRPHAFGREETAEACPFCPGNEAATPPTIVSVGDPWRVRVFSNKYRAAEGHEVIVESPRHEATLADVDMTEVANVWIERYGAHSKKAAYVSLFKNDGERAGASIDHLHSQLIPLPFVPPRVERERAAFARARRCPLCAAVESQPIVHRNDHFISIVPGGGHAYAQWIVPRAHANEMASVIDLAAFGDIVQRAAGSARSIGSSSNIVFMNFPQESAAHWYIDLFPRTAAIAGFELGTGTFIDMIDPAAAARRLKT